ESLEAWKAALTHCVYVGVGDEESREFLASLGANEVEVIGDLALSIGRPRHRPLREPLRVGLNLGANDPPWGNPAAAEGELVELAGRLRKKGAWIEYIPMHPLDEFIGRRMIARISEGKSLGLWHNYRRLKDSLNRMKSYDLVVGQRLHSSILACAFGVPTINLSYNPKGVSFMKAMGLEDYSVRL